MIPQLKICSLSSVSQTQTANEAALVLIVWLSKRKTSNVFVSTSSRSPCFPSFLCRYGLFGGVGP